MTRLADDGRIGLAAIGAAAALIGMTMVKLGDQHTWGGVLALGWMTVVIGLAVAVAAAGWARLDGGDLPTGVAGIAAGVAVAGVGLGLVGGLAQITHHLRRLVRMPTKPPRTDDDHTTS
jgi:hypothetical protein